MSVSRLFPNYHQVTPVGCSGYPLLRSSVTCGTFIKLERKFVGRDKNGSDKRASKIPLGFHHRRSLRPDGMDEAGVPPPLHYRSLSPENIAEIRLNCSRLSFPQNMDPPTPSSILTALPAGGGPGYTRNTNRGHVVGTKDVLLILPGESRVCKRGPREEADSMSLMRPNVNGPLNERLHCPRVATALKMCAESRIVCTRTQYPPRRMGHRFIWKTSAGGKHGVTRINYPTFLGDHGVTSNLPSGCREAFPAPFYDISRAAQGLHQDRHQENCSISP